MTLFNALILSILVLAPLSAPAQDADPPFGSNNPFASSDGDTSAWLSDLGLTWISDHLPRRNIERIKNGTVKYNFENTIAAKISEYATESHSKAWFVVNVDSLYPFTDGRQITIGPSTGSYVPAGPASLDAYAAFLDQLVRWVNGRELDWKALYWSVDNEHSSLFIPAFCGDTIEPVCAADAARAYADLVERSYQVIRAVDPDAKIVFGGVGASTSGAELHLYYREALLALKAKTADGYFDFFDVHDFNVFKKYDRATDKRDIDFFRTLLSDTGFPGKPILVKAGGTHSGMDLASPNRRLRKLQTEREQAEHLIKRFVHHAAHGVRLTLWGTIREDEVEPESTAGELFHQNGLVYNGLTRTAVCDPAVELPCPDPGDGVHKLSYFTFKHLMEKAWPLDWSTIETLSDGAHNVYAYKLHRAGAAQSAIFAWWDYFKDKKGATSKTVTFGGFGSADVVVTDLLPAQDSGAAVTDYSTAFPTSLQPVTGGSVTITLGKSPVLVEE
jgi:hypothetical protein